MFKLISSLSFSISFGIHLIRTTQNLDNEDSLGNLMQLCGSPGKCVIITASSTHLFAYSVSLILYENKEHQLEVNISLHTSNRIKKTINEVFNVS